MITQQRYVSRLPNDKLFEVTKLKAFADDKLNVAKMTISLFAYITADDKLNVAKMTISLFAYITHDVTKRSGVRLYSKGMLSLYQMTSCLK